MKGDKNISVVKNVIIENETVYQKKNDNFGFLKNYEKAAVIHLVACPFAGVLHPSFSRMPQFLPGPLAVWQGAIESESGRLSLLIYVGPLFESDCRMVSSRKLSRDSDWFTNWSYPTA